MRILSIPVLAAAGLTLAACETMPPAPPPPPPQAAPSAYVFRSQDFAWSAIPGTAGLAARVSYRQGPTTFACTNAVLIPETAFSTRRMMTLYGSATASAMTEAEVRSRTTPAPNGFGDFVRSAGCDAQSRFSFGKLPDGAWFVITVARPTAGTAAPMALMKRVVTKTGQTVSVEL